MIKTHKGLRTQFREKTSTQRSGHGPSPFPLPEIAWPAVFASIPIDLLLIQSEVTCRSSTDAKLLPLLVAAATISLLGMYRHDIVSVCMRLRALYAERSWRIINITGAGIIIALLVSELIMRSIGAPPFVTLVWIFVLGTTAVKFIREYRNRMGLPASFSNHINEMLTLLPIVATRVIGLIGAAISACHGSSLLYYLPFLVIMILGFLTLEQSAQN